MDQWSLHMNSIFSCLSVFHDFLSLIRDRDVRRWRHYLTRLARFDGWSGANLFLILACHDRRHRHCVCCCCCCCWYCCCYCCCCCCCCCCWDWSLGMKSRWLSNWIFDEPREWQDDDTNPLFLEDGVAAIANDFDVIGACRCGRHRHRHWCDGEWNWKRQILWWRNGKRFRRHDWWMDGRRFATHEGEWWQDLRWRCPSQKNQNCRGLLGVVSICWLGQHILCLFLTLRDVRVHVDILIQMAQSPITFDDPMIHFIKNGFFTKYFFFSF